MSTVKTVSEFPLHLGLGATAEWQDRFTGDMAWYMAYGQRNASDGLEGRLVSMHTFSESWTSWEMHPQGSEIVLCTAGRLRLTQENPDGTIEVADLDPGQAVVNAPGVWHTADVLEGPATAVFITAGAGTEIRER